jgi:hypothetical protein
VARCLGMAGRRGVALTADAHVQVTSRRVPRLYECVENAHTQLPPNLGATPKLVVRGPVQPAPPAPGHQGRSPPPLFCADTGQPREPSGAVQVCGRMSEPDAPQLGYVGIPSLYPTARAGCAGRVCAPQRTLL